MPIVPSSTRRIQELPINGRDMNTLLSDVTPGVEQVIDVNGGVRTSGMMVYSTNYVQDGAASNNREFGGSMNIAGLESAGEVRVEHNEADELRSHCVGDGAAHFRGRRELYSCHPGVP